VSSGQDAAGSGRGPPEHLLAEPQPQVEGSGAKVSREGSATGGQILDPRQGAVVDAASDEESAGTAVAILPERGSVEITRVIAVVNQKGGVGKSTTAVNLGAALAEMGKTVLVIDLDPQGNASTGLGIDQGNREITTYQVLTGEIPPRDAVADTPVPGLWAIPSTIDLAGAEIELVSQFSRETRLRRSIEELSGSFEFIFLDCPPSLGLLTVNALTAADELIVPIQCEYYALEGLGQLLRNVRLVQHNLNQRLILSGIVLTMFDPRTRLSEQVVEEVRRYFGRRVYDVVIPRTVRLSEAPGFGLPVTHYAPRSKGAAAYRNLAREFLERPVSGEPLPAEESPRMPVTQPVPSDEDEEMETAEAGSEQESTPTADAAPVGAAGAGEVAGTEPEGEAGTEPESESEPPTSGQEAEWESLGGAGLPGDGEPGDSSQEDQESGGRWRLFRRKQGGEP
jgi:chromosome partitioning protein